MRNPFFRFKKFEVWHDKCAMKVGTDGVLLGAWAPVDQVRSILDIGTGTGLVALMLAQRSSAFITGLDIDEKAVSQAKENVARSPWSNRLGIVHADVTSWLSGQQFDLIVSNPPYFNASLKSGDCQRNLARHTDSLSDSSLLSSASRLLTPEGRFVVILPYDKLDIYNKESRSCGLYLTRQLDVFTQQGNPPRRVILVFEKQQKEKMTEQLTIEEERHQYTPEYIDLTCGFYLNM